LTHRITHLKAEFIEHFGDYSPNKKPANVMFAGFC